ncbi:hypothetical protein N9K47_00275 [bacterium]|nr:hypothetical protein [bacterium]
MLEARLESTNEPLFLCGNNSERDEKGTDRVDAEINAEDAFIYTVGTGGPGGVLPGLDTLLSVMRQNETCSFKLSGEQLALMPFVANSGDEDAAQFEQTQVVLQATPGLAQTPAVENWAQFVAELPAGTAVVGELTLVTIGKCP